MSHDALGSSHWSTWSVLHYTHYTTLTLHRYTNKMFSTSTLTSTNLTFHVTAYITSPHPGHPVSESLGPGIQGGVLMVKESRSQGVKGWKVDS